VSREPPGTVKALTPFTLAVDANVAFWPEMFTTS
jgi:hypothetical protein